MLLFIAALLGITAAVYLLVMVLFALEQGDAATGMPSLWNPGLFGLVGLGVTALIGSGSLIKSIALSAGGGTAVAESLGGRLITRNTDDPQERRLLNVVDEMALAAGMNPPQVYVLDEEEGINAFAAGIEIDKAVVAVTRGALVQLKRDELQGVVAHEFSHILNGDMRLNLRLIGVLHGILLLTILGRVMMRGASRGGRSGRRGSSTGFFLAGLGLLLIGYIGVLFGNLIKAAVSREREYLADASAVQFTRNPAGLAGALSRIASASVSSKITHPNADAMRHLFFDEGVAHFMRWFASHPPIEERIARIAPGFRWASAATVSETIGLERATSPQSDAIGSGALGLAFGHSTDARRMPLAAGELSARVGSLSPEQVALASGVLDRFPQTMRDDLKAPMQAQAVLQGMLLAESSNPMAVLKTLAASMDATLAARIVAHAEWFKRAGAEVRLPALELAIPALLELPPRERERVKNSIEQVAGADGPFGLFEFTLIAMLEHALGTGEAGGRPHTASNDLASIRRDVRDLLALLARLGHASEAAAAAAFARAAAQAPIDRLEVLPGEVMPVDFARLDALLGRLAGLAFVFRGKLIEACVAAISADGEVTVKEAEMLRAIGARLGCPVPPMVAGAV